MRTINVPSIAITSLCPTKTRYGTIADLIPTFGIEAAKTTGCDFLASFSTLICV